MTNILGISAFYHDSAAALVRDGDIVAAAQEERFTRKKHDDGVSRARRRATACARRASPRRELDYVVFYDKPLLKFDRLLETYLAYAPAGFALVPQGDAALAQAEAAARAGAAQGARRRVPQALPLHRAPRVARRERVLPVALRRGRHPDDRRRRRVGDRELSASGAATGSSSRTSCASRTRSACSTRRSPTTAASR